MVIINDEFVHSKHLNLQHNNLYFVLRLICAFAGWDNPILPYTFLYNSDLKDLE